MNEMPKKRVYATIREDLVEWMEKKIEEGIYANKSHAIERALIVLRKKEGKKDE